MQITPAQRKKLEAESDARMAKRAAMRKKKKAVTKKPVRKPIEKKSMPKKAVKKKTVKKKSVRNMFADRTKAIDKAGGF